MAKSRVCDLIITVNVNCLYQKQSIYTASFYLLAKEGNIYNHLLDRDAVCVENRRIVKDYCPLLWWLDRLRRVFSWPLPYVLE